MSYCATCDGYFFKDGKQVIVVDGGNTAITDALYLHHLGAKVTLVHRRDTLRAEKRLQESFKQSGIPALWNSDGDIKRVLTIAYFDRLGVPRLS